MGYLSKKTEEQDLLMSLTSNSGQTVIDLILMFKFSSLLLLNQVNFHIECDKFFWGTSVQSPIINELFKFLHLDILRWCFWGLYIAIEETFKNITAAYVLGLNELNKIDCDKIIYLFTLDASQNIFVQKIVK